MVESATNAGRRTPQESRALIVAGARQALADVGMGGLTVSNVMDRTALGRSSFYVHFKDIDELTLGLLEENVALFAEPSTIWFEDPTAENMALAIRRILDVWEVNRGWWGALITAAMAPRKVLAQQWRVTEVDTWAPLIAALVPEDGPAIRAGGSQVGVARAFVLFLFSYLAEISAIEDLDMDSVAADCIAVGLALFYGVPD